MKKNLNTVLLILEIASISLFHAIKIKQAQHQVQSNGFAHVSTYANPEPSVKANGSYTLIK
jgi:hypothetical protein